MVKAYLAFGSNIGNKIKYIKAAYALLERSNDISIIKKSGFCFSKAYGGDDLNDFINSVCEIETNLSPFELLTYIKNIETILGRKKTQPKRYENRQIDIDILFYGDEKISKKGLIIPHKDIENRDFVLVPLSEICPDKILPSGKTLDEAIKLLNNTTKAVSDD
ncbi:MAG: 2-amino-4-hydroxy-6-hydroxymethyldihydropteridine diphosphokinase [bacterium]|nr:2-amino-4-hydroxy-6-hydroxymethyldihydropteridine diphosphokinase [bacterium]